MRECKEPHHRARLCAGVGWEVLLPRVAIWELHKTGKKYVTFPKVFPKCTEAGSCGSVMAQESRNSQ